MAAPSRTQNLSVIPTPELLALDPQTYVLSKGVDSSLETSEMVRWVKRKKERQH